MKEVKLGRYAGPFAQVPYEHFIQSPIGLVPKDGGKKTRLIFHLSYEFGPGEDFLNACTPDEICTMKYKDLDHAVKLSLGLKETTQDHNANNDGIFYGKTDLTSAFRILPLSPFCFPLLAIEGNRPEDWEVVVFSLTSVFHLDQVEAAHCFKNFRTHYSF